MEEEVGIKVTRLRRRLSVEAEEVKSPATQSTPTKKRGGRLAAKPQLELIDENVPEAAPKRTRKSTARDITEPVEEKAVTPSRRSTRIRSNTSIVSETPDVAEDRGTPSRRSTRIKSNTSIISETVQNVNSPRAKRAANRRTSQAGSDNEAPVTPARQTRRTRKDSTSSIDKQEPNAGKLGSQINEVIVEESENNVQETKGSESPKSDSPVVRKSPRLIGKSDRKSSSLDTDNNENKPQIEKKQVETTIDAGKVVPEPKADETNEVEDHKPPEQNNLSMTSTKLLQDLDEAPKKGKTDMNKSATAAEEPQFKSKRNRTKSWTTISVEPANENDFCSDSEASKRNKKNNTLNLSNISGSGDGIINMSINNEEDKVQNLSQNFSDKKKKKRHDKSMTGDTDMSKHEPSPLNKSLNKSVGKILEPKEDSKTENEEQNLNSSKKHDSSATEKILGEAPRGVVQSLVLEDSDSNHGSIGKDNNNKDFDSGDQCVPVVDHHLELEETSKETANNMSYEPMDIDETMPENISLSTFVEKNDSIRRETEEPKEKRQSILNVAQVKSKRKSGINNSVSEDIVDQVSNKSQRKSSTAEIIENGETDTNKSKRKSSISNVISEDTTDGNFNMSNQVNMGNQDDSINKKSNKSKRKSSISNFVTEEIEEVSDKSTRKSAVTDIVNDYSINKESNNSKRKSSLSNIVSDDTDKSNKSIRKSLISDQTDEDLNSNLNKSTRKSSVSVAVADVSINKQKTAMLDIGNDYDTTNKSSNKSKRKSSVSNVASDDSINNKSKNKSILATESQTLDKTDNANKSTLVLSQIKDTSESEINMESTEPKDNNESQLSKSVNLPKVDTEKDSDKKNLSLTYSTSTPLQQKSMKKLGLQINSSIIAPNSANKIESKNKQNASEKEVSISSQENNSEEEERSDASEEDSDASEEEEEDYSKEKSKMIDGEAEEASADYESGDSRDEDEKEYEEQNEIIEKGETLDSDDEEEYSDDSDYEKGSFIVSSDEEDNDLLSGSGDDLDMSDNELKMSKKSKKKYNERKAKEQKKASREMYEARHQLNESDKSIKTKSKKNNRQRLESSSTDSEEEVTVQPKKNARQRIDSSQDMTQSDADKSVSKKKKAKRLSESVYEENEKEITIAEETQVDTIDPLILKNIIKAEPKTPQKDLNISTVAVTNVDDVEEVDVDENVSIMKSNQTSDPLQAILPDKDAEDDADEDSISENEEITQNYESVLNNLNNSKIKKISSLNISLDLNKKSKEKAKEPIVDQLNLTQVKKGKKKKADAFGNVETNKLDKSLNKSTEKVENNINVFSEGSSDSIDMKLLFPEDSNDSVEIVAKSGKNKNEKVKETTQNDDTETAEDFIPLKRTPGKTNILENSDIVNKSKNESLLNVSGKKKNKRKSSQNEEGLAMSTQEDENLGFFIDTTGDLAAVNKTDPNISIKSSGKKKQKNNVSFANIDDSAVAEADDNSNDAPLEVSYISEKNKSKQELNLTQNNESVQDTIPTETPSQSAKKKKKGLNSSQNADLSSIEKTGDGSAKKSKKTMSESETHEIIETENGAAESIKNFSIIIIEKVINKDDDVHNTEGTSKKRKRKSSANQTTDEIIINDDVELIKEASLVANNKKKKRKISNNDEDIKTQVQDSDAQTQEQEKSPVKNAKKKNKVPQPQEVDEDGEEYTKKNKKRKERDDDDASKISKILKQNSFDTVHVPRLPTNVLKQLDDKPKKDLNQATIVQAKKEKVISTTSFVVEEAKKRKNKPSNYLEESVYLNDDLEKKKQKNSIKNPKVLPFIPTASTSDSGFTTNFKVNVIPQVMQFVAQSSDITNFKNDYLHKKRIKKLGTFEMYKRQRNIKISKF